MELRELCLDDLMKVRVWRNKNLKSLRTPFLLTSQMQLDFWETINDRRSSHRYFALKNSELVGMGGITNIQWENSIGEISLIIDPKITGNGFGTTAVSLLFEAGFNQLNLKTIFGECYYCNPAIEFWKKITQKCSGYTTILPNRKFWEGTYYNSLYFSVDRDGFTNGTIYRP